MKEVKFGATKKVGQTGFKVKDLTKISKVESISPPSVFIGSKLKYPNMNVGILSPLEKEEDASLYDDYEKWAGESFSIKQVLLLRNNLLNSRMQKRATDVRQNSKFLEIAKNIAVSSLPVDVEIELKGKPLVGSKRDRVLSPLGMRAGAKRAKITSNVKIEKKVDSVINDDLKASKGLEILYKSKISSYSLSKILSIGAMGMKKNRKLVPTRWSITATDDFLGKFLHKQIKDYNAIEDYNFFFGDFMGNQYLVLMFPGVWSFELFELYYPGSSWNPSKDFRASTDMEGFQGRKNYAFNTAGGYYAARLPILEYLNKIRRQAQVIAIRLETPTYWAAMGVWVVRESVKKAIANGPMKFRDKKEFLESAKKIAKIKYDFDTDHILNQSKLLKQINTQKTLKDWF